jgi:hypothetical protein
MNLDHEIDAYPGASSSTVVFVKVEVAHGGESQGGVFGAWEHERGGYKRLLKQGTT